MPAQTHSEWINRQNNGNAVDLDGIGAVDVRMAIVTEASLDPDTDDLFSTLTPVATNVGWTGPILLTNLTCALDGSFNLQFNADLISDIPSDIGGFDNGQTVVFYQVVSGYIIASQSHSIPFGNKVVPISIQWLAGIWEGVII